MKSMFVKKALLIALCATGTGSMVVKASFWGGLSKSWDGLCETGSSIIGGYAGAYRATRDVVFSEPAAVIAGGAFLLGSVVIAAPTLFRGALWTGGKLLNYKKTMALCAVLAGLGMVADWYSPEPKDAPASVPAPLVQSAAQPVPAPL